MATHLNLVVVMLLVTLLSTPLAASDSESTASHQNAPSPGYPQPWIKILDKLTHTTVAPPPANLAELEPTLCLLRELTVEETRNQSRNFYVCPNHRGAGYVECCDSNDCCMPSYVRQFLSYDNATTFEKFLGVFALVFMVVFFLLMCICCCIPMCCGCENKQNDYAGCATKTATEGGPQYQTMAQDCQTAAGTAGPMLLNHHGVPLTLASPPMPPNGHNHHQQFRMAIAETRLVDLPDHDPTSGSSTGSGCSSSRIITIHANSSRGSSPTTDSSLVSLIPGRSANGTPTMVSTFSKPPVKSILKMNNSSNGNHFPATIKPFGYREQRGMVVGNDGAGGSAVSRAPIWSEQHML